MAYYPEPKLKRQLNLNYIPPALVKKDSMVNVYWKNKYHFGKEIVHSPITKDNKAIGVVTDVTPEFIYGLVYFSEVRTIINDERKVISFEIR